jgi:hypothetical protein
MPRFVLISVDLADGTLEVALTAGARIIPFSLDRR